jgi:NTE family protein
MHALVISGGGSKGAFAGGVAEYLINECKIDYDLFVGSSTGSLLVSHLALGKIDKIKEVFTSVSQKDIFNISPFYIKKKNGVNSVSINHFNTLRTFIMRRRTFGESKNLRKLLYKTLSPEEFKQLRINNEKVLITVSNLTKCRTELKSNLECTYDDFIDWIWASSNYVPFMSLLCKDGFEYADGGFGMHTPIQAAINNGATSIDVIVLEKELVDKTVPHPTNAFATLMQVFEHMTDQIYRNDITIGNLRAKIRDVKIRFYHLPRDLTSLPLIFDPVEMKEWWEEGFEYAKKENPTATIIRKEE